MSTKFKTVITTAGAAKLAAATVPGGKKINLNVMAVGDGGGKLPVPDAGQTQLVNEVWRHTLNKISQDNRYSNYIVAELVIPPEVGGFWMREIGLYDDEGTLIAVANMAESYKPELAEGSGRAQTCRMVIIVSSVESVALSIDSTMVMATQDYVDDRLAEHEKSRRHPDATLKEKGFTQLSNATDSESETLAATPKAVKTAYDLANAKYTAQDATTTRKGIVQLSNATDSVSETLAATPKAVKVAYDLANAKYTAQDATTARKGIIQLSNATDSTSETLAATPKAVKAAMDNANGRLEKNSNGADIPNKPLFTENIGLKETVERAKNAVQKTGDEMSGKLTLPQTSSFGVNTNNTLGGSSIAIGDNDTGLKGNGDGNLAFMANNVLAGYFNENELQHSKKMLTKNFQALVDDNWPEGAGGFSGQLSSEAPFSVPMVRRQNNDNNFFPFLKGKVSLESGYPVAASFGILTSGNTNFPQIAIHAKTDFDVNDKIWIFDVATGEFRAPGRITATEILLSGKSRVAPDGNLYGDVWGGWLNDFLNNNFARKNTASLQDWGWIRDDSTGFIMQWGTLGSSNGTYNFPRAFPVGCLAIFVTNTSQQGGSVDNAFGYPVSNSQFFAATKASTDGNVVNGYPVAWFAIGR
ncbi:tail fiber protein [Salmonella enterica subsp. enterica serovar Oranienburg]|nr:tail fiber protein [Salmonella enterica]EIF4926305.1 tail fiber protein [Salmonella enterica subsp. enterica serovar Oranienburg]EIM9031052.1 tail fiber protein [Salmonella enterica subsp. enterica serovar Oranienburg]ELC8750296.1 tail fiber protein [Salmonella enterica]